MLIVQLLSLSLLVLPTAVVALSERDILLEFYKETGGPSWNTNSGWEDNASDICAWFGVICEGETEASSILSGEDNTSRRRRLADDPLVIPHSSGGQVIGLKLDSNNLVGRVPATLWKLPNLRTLHVSYNSVDVAFTGTSDSLVEVKMHSTATNTFVGIANFPNLLSLHMSGTQLGHSQFPRELLSLKELRNLHLADSQMEGKLPEDINKLTKLRELNLMNNEFTGLLPETLGQLSQLRMLTLSKNHFEGRLSGWMATLPNLEELFLEFNQFSGPLLAFDSQPYLTNLYLDNNDLTGNIPANFLSSVLKPDQGVVRVNLDNNRLGDVVPDSLDSLAGLPLKITLAGNYFTSFASETLCDNVDWMDGNVASFQCNAILCPVRTSAALGRQMNGTECARCDTGTYLGQTTCLDQDDRKALQSLYLATGGDHWRNNDGWLDEATPMCKWYGITCYEDANDNGSQGVDPRHVGRVKHIQLSNNGLIGKIPNDIYALNLVTLIDVSWNRVVFPFDNIGDSQFLHVLNIGHTDTTSFEGIEAGNAFFRIINADRLNIGGTIPKEIFHNSNLNILSLNNCDLQGTIPTDIGTLTTLKELYMWGNNLAGPIPSEIANLSNLRVVSLAKNQLTGTLPARLEELSALTAFSVKDQVTKGGGLSGNLLPFQYNAMLTDLFLSNNKFAGTIPLTLLNSVDKTKTLIVDLSANQLTGTVPGTLAQFEQMDLFVEDNLIVRIDEALCSKRDWMWGNVADFGCDAILCPKYTTNSLGRQAFDSCQDCTDPVVGDSMGQTVCGARDAIMSERKTLELLYDTCGGPNWLHQDNWKTSGQYCDWFGISCDDANSVVSIVLGSNNLEGRVPTEIFGLPNLKRLSMFGNAISLSFEGIENAVNLESLVLDDTRLDSLDGIGKARGLVELNVRANGIGGRLPDELANLNNLQTLTLSSNVLSGSLPVWLSKLNKLNTLLLEDNSLTGSLISFEEYHNIVLLNLANNKLTGSIPPFFLATAPQDDKVFVDLSGNWLTGTVPYSLLRLNRLSIHLQNNRIEAIDPALCRQIGWNDYDVQSYGCGGILCPIGTYGDKGRLSSDQSTCEKCDKAKYMGATVCSSSARIFLSTATAVLAVSGLIASIP